MSTENFSTAAPTFWALGLGVVPVEHGTKQPAKEIKGWPGFASSAPRAELQQEWLSRYATYGIGLLLGTEVMPNHVIGAIDVDDDRLVRVTDAILGKVVSGKVGKKGATQFVLMPKEPKIKSTQIRGSGGIGNIDVLASGRMTVLPPTIHKDTGKPYEWIGKRLQVCKLDELPTFDHQTLNVLKVVCESTHTEALLEGKTTHDAGVALTAHLVSAGCDDGTISNIIKALLPADYKGNSLAELPGWIDSAREKGFGRLKALPLDDATAHVIEKHLEPIVYVIGDNFLRYSDGYWASVTDSDIDRLAKQLLTPTLGPKRQVRPILENVRRCFSAERRTKELWWACRADLCSKWDGRCAQWEPTSSLPRA
jgi:hypothetical protein